MKYTVVITRSAQKYLAKIPKSWHDPIEEKVRALADDPRPRGCEKNVAGEGWHIRAGNYRVVYEIDDEEHLVTVRRIRDRKDVYR